MAPALRVVAMVSGELVIITEYLPGVVGLSTVCSSGSMT